MIPKKLKIKIDNRNEENALRKLDKPSKLIDFSSNDYIGFSKNETIFKNTYNYLKNYNISQNGATGSRLLSGNHELYTIVEKQLCEIYNSEATLIFNSGYNANLGFFSCVPQKGDYIFYDEYSHASIRDGISMSHAKAYKFKHNNLNDLKAKLLRIKPSDNNEIYIVTESVFSMDGDTPDLKLLSKISQTHSAHLIIDEAHAIGILGEKALGLTQHINPFAKIITFGKAMGCHGAAILCSASLKEFLINFSRPFIYTTAMPPHSLATILSASTILLKTKEIEKLKRNITFFKSEIKRLNLKSKFIESESAIHCCIISGNKNVKLVAKALQEKNYNVKPILSPTVKKGEERLRFCIHSYNTQEEITEVLQLLANFAT
ncbi:pyridoxal phosphate-dependent aminotransferase family protein [Lacinutrix sp. 5H-3-7-4]|uniref:aminotransferase class I/II-fold pyridoxal phosphate-dependent enzyme n=1 Tax=Lacinutrix sp. (strain 5H-3-7-4) TaxID=983544 RepID=UPI00020A345C|nr:pyridoxal phosphate-dependent aminotransferase family protein [Lacinutrix sp. 5H-3-7-4]AEH00688.1 8-amino-7-oxononanoate synthase [Lacinutrix sp. 5H-3-7-4]